MPIHTPAKVRARKAAQKAKKSSLSGRSKPKKTASKPRAAKKSTFLRTKPSGTRKR